MSYDLTRLVFPDILKPTPSYTYILNAYLNMSNVHGFGNLGNNPRNNNPPRNNDYGGREREVDDGNGGIMDNFNRPVIED
jgi:hypothetical protein